MGAQMTSLHEMARSLGGDVVGRGVVCPGPGHSPRDRSLSVTPSSAAPDGFIVHSHAGDDWRDCRAHVLALLGRPAEGYQPPAPRPKADHGALARELWSAAQDPRATTIVARYLASRALDLDDDIAGRVVRFHPSCPWGKREDGTVERHPCMLTAFRAIEGDQLVAIHRTALTEDGCKIDRKMLGPVAGAAIKVDDDQDVEQGLTIAEGFETALAARLLGLRPVWALGSAGAIAAFPVLSGIDALTICAETDDSGANARAARECARRWVSAGRDVIIATPRVGGDMNGAIAA